MSLPIKEIAFVLHPVSDVPRARRFYEQVLGLKPAVQVELSAGQWWLEYEIAGVALAVTNLFPSGGGGSTTLAFEVTDLDATRALIGAAKTPVTSEIIEYPPCRMFGIRSPDGHPILFHQRKT